MAYEGSVELISGIKTKNNGTFPLVDAPDVRIDDQTRLSDFVQSISDQTGSANGFATLDQNGKVPSSQLPSYVDDVLEYDALSNFPATGETGKIYVAKDTNKTYRWSGSAYTVISETLALGETSSTAYRGDRGKAAYAHAVTNKGSAFSSGFYKITTNSEGHVTAATAVQKSDITAFNLGKADVGLGNVDNTADADKPVSTAVQTELNKKVSNTTTVNGHALSSNVTVTKADVELGNVDNTADIDKPVSTAVQTELNKKVSNTTTVNGHALSSNVTVTKSDVGLGNVDNTADIDKPVSTAVQTELNRLKTRIDETDSMELLKIDYIPGTLQSITYSQDGHVSSISHINQNGNNVIRTDTFIFGENTITETRVLSTGESFTIIFDSQQMTVAATYASA